VPRGILLIDLPESALRLRDQRSPNRSEWRSFFLEHVIPVAQTWGHFWCVSCLPSELPIARFLLSREFPRPQRVYRLTEPEKCPLRSRLRCSECAAHRQERDRLRECRNNSGATLARRRSREKSKNFRRLALEPDHLLHGAGRRARCVWFTAGFPLDQNRRPVAEIFGPIAKLPPCFSHSRKTWSGPAPLTPLHGGHIGPCSARPECSTAFFGEGEARHIAPLAVGEADRKSLKRKKTERTIISGEGTFLERVNSGLLNWRDLPFPEVRRKGH